MNLVISLFRRYRVIAWISLFSVLLTVFAYRSWSELTSAFPLVAHANGGWIALTLVAQLLTLGCIALKYRTILKRLGAVLPAAALARIHVRRHFVSSVVPFGGPAGIASFTRDLNRRQVPGSTALYASLLLSVVNEIAFAIFLTPVLLWLLTIHRATRTMIAGEIVLLALLVSAAGAVVAAIRTPRFRAAILTRVPGRVRAALADAAAHGIRPRDLFRAVPYALGVNLLGVAMLTFSLWAVGAHPSLATILAARTVASLTMLLIPTWQGAGAVELTVSGTLIAGGVSVPAAVAAVALFRLAQFWFPLLIGGAAFIEVQLRHRPVLLRLAGMAGMVGAVMVVAVLV
jgi:uncharacterized membrane protein YbhN (UPF0104 family)